LGVAMLILAIVVGTSRIYLVQHFLKDVYLGAVFGVLIAMSVYVYQSRFPYNPNHWIDRSLLLKRKKELV
jgi:membrane-associated phospholipid phosphatase